MTAGFGVKPLGLQADTLKLLLPRRVSAPGVPVAAGSLATAKAVWHAAT